MPKGDRTGPLGTGAMSGGAAGFCAGLDIPGYAHPMNAGGAGMHAGRRRGGRGRCFRPFAAGRMDNRGLGGFGSALQPMDPGLEKESLMNRSRALQSELDAVHRRLAEIEPEDKTT